MRKILILLLFCITALHADPCLESERLVIANTRIHLNDYPDAYNPSLTTFENGYLLSFRYTPDRTQGRISYMGVVLLNEALQPVSKPQLLGTRTAHSKTPSQSEDARVIWYQGNLYLLFNDNFDDVNASITERRDMFLAKLSYINKKFTLEAPLKLTHDHKYLTQLCQKNWAPFVWNDRLLLSYQLAPHEVLEPDLPKGNCRMVHETPTPTRWMWGQLRGGTPAQLVDGEYLAFFHSSSQIHSTTTGGKTVLHYVMGAYTFSANPPFEITKMSACPIRSNDFYPKSHGKKVIFPGGFVAAGPVIHVAYGKQDAEMWIATLDKARLMSTLIPVRNKK